MPILPTLSDIRASIAQLEERHQRNGVVLSGRILHVCHSLPVTCTLHVDKDESSSSTRKWKLGPRYGHAAMISGIRSLSATHEQIIVGWTGDIEGTEGEKKEVGEVTEEDRLQLNDLIFKGGEQEDVHEAHDEGHHHTGYVAVWMPSPVAHGYYDGYCKQILWPLFHYLLWQDVATEYASADSHYPHYEAANAAFARRIAEIYQPGDLIWVHDYHLLLLPNLLRELLPDAVVGLFVHTPFPSSEVFRCLPRRKEILDGMLGANLVCFQNYSYTRHFISTCIRVCGYESHLNGRGIENPSSSHVTAVSYCPVGIDAERVARDVLRPGIKPKFDALKTLYQGKKIIVGRDKLDVVKGVLQKLRAFEKMLQIYPEWVGRVVMIQVTSPSLADSPKLERQVSELVAHINGTYGSLDFIPCHHYHQTLKKDEFYALLSVADLAVITPLRDGMNTTSMEFVIAQERTKRSPSVLSELMGVMGILGALWVNPWDLHTVASAMHRALLMPEAEKATRHKYLHDVVTTRTSHMWANVLTEMLLQQMTPSVHGKNDANAAGGRKGIPYLDIARLRKWYDAASSVPSSSTIPRQPTRPRAKPTRLFFFDYDGTLAPIVKIPSAAVPSEQALNALNNLCKDERNLVYIISGRDADFLDEHLGSVGTADGGRGLGFSAEHGGFVKEPRKSTDPSPWRNFTSKLDMSWMSEVYEVFRYYTERTTGSHIEVKKSSITWHYRAADPEWGQFQCRQCQDLLENNVAHKRPIEVLVGKKNLEVRPIAVNKGEIVKRLVYKHPQVEFIFCAGDDKTDEDMFRALKQFTERPSPSPKAESSIIDDSGKIEFVMDAPLSVTLVDDDDDEEEQGCDNSSNNTSANSKYPPMTIHLSPEAVFTVAVGHSSKRTLASWHVTSPAEVVGAVEGLLGLANSDEALEKREE
ncbi:glycosyltransferase family 20 protein [Lentinula aciculospora]|uniref:Glycosyltransferase family 20 protein n=1 Tax=Lentinula aciculospora TaxID=153920 RepID=A0A9W9AV08_9AGAR|nr:glycosyltransferase family 20 protein [Lentinula aciculospora]